MASTTEISDEARRALEELTIAIRGAAAAEDEIAKNAFGVFKKASEKFATEMKSNGLVFDQTSKKWVSAREREMELLSASMRTKYEEIQAGRKKILEDVQRDTLFKKELQSLGYKLDIDGKLLKTTIELTKEQQKIIKEIKGQEESLAKVKKMQTDLVQALKDGVKNVAGSMGRFTLGLAQGDSSFKSLNGMIDAVGGAMAGIARSIPIIGGFFEAAAKAATEAAKTVVDLLERQLKGFQELSNAGGLVADGMTGLGRQFKNSGMTFNGFIKVVKENAGALAAYGNTVGGGAEKFALAVGTMTKESDSQLRKLGLTADEIGAAAAQYLNMEIRLGRGRAMSQEQLRQGTINYVKELDALAKVTGLSREDAQKQRDELLADSRYRAARNQMTESGAKALDAFIMQLKDPEMKRGFMDLASGAVSTEAASKLVTSLGPEAMDMVDKLKAAKPETIAKTFDDVNIQFQDRAKQFMTSFGDVAKFLDPSVLGNFASFADVAGGKYRTSMEEAIKTQKAQIESTDDLTKKTTEAQKNMEKLSVKMFEVFEKALPKSAKAIEKFTDALISAIDNLTASETTAAPPAGAGGGQRGRGAPVKAAEGSIATTTADLKKRGLRVKEGDVQSEGAGIHPNLLNLAEKIQNEIPGFNYFSSFNDQYHAMDNNSMHSRGLALDFVLQREPNEDEAARIKAKLKELGASHVIDEYHDPTSRSTGGHFHVNVGAGMQQADTGGFFKAKSAFPAILHPNELVLNADQITQLQKTLSQVEKRDVSESPLGNFMSSSSGMSDTAVRDVLNMQSNLIDTLVSKLDNIESRLSRSNDIQENILNYTMV